MQKIIHAELVFDGEKFLHDYVVFIAGDIIAAILPFDECDAGMKVHTSCHIIAPAFIDLQVYGAAGKLISVFPTEDTLTLMANEFSKSGTYLFVPTVATNTKEVFYASIDAVRNYKNHGGKAVHGLHLEGPWINKLKRGAHVESLVHSPTLKEVEELLDHGKDVITMITLAPEVCDEKIIRLIQSKEINISAGHSNATFNEANLAFEKGIHCVTHLFNAMSGLDHRKPGLAAATMLDKKVMASIIADGHHVHYDMIRLAKETMLDRLYLITDAVTETKSGPYQHYAEGDKFVANNVLSGSSLTMLQAVKNCVSHAGIGLEESLRMASLYPARVLGIENEYGKIAVGYKTKIIMLDEKLNIISPGVEDNTA